jgi:hypothetical protein
MLGSGNKSRNLKNKNPDKHLGTVVTKFGNDWNWTFNFSVLLNFICPAGVLCPSFRSRILRFIDQFAIRQST